MKTLKESKSVYTKIKNAMPYNNEVIIKIKEDKTTFHKSYDFKVVNGEMGEDDYEIEAVASTDNINVLNNVLRLLLNCNYFVNFEV